MEEKKTPEQCLHNEVWEDIEGTLFRIWTEEGLANAASKAHSTVWLWKRKMGRFIGPQQGAVWVKATSGLPLHKAFWNMPGEHNNNECYFPVRIDGHRYRVGEIFDDRQAGAPDPIYYFVINGDDYYDKDFHRIEWLDESGQSKEGGKISDDAHEKEIMLKAFDKVRQIFEGRQWVMEGRGSYPYNDDRYREEVRYMYDEFDSLVKDTWANIKSHSSEYRQAIIEEYVKGKEGDKEREIMSFYKWMRESGWHEHSSGQYYYKSKDFHQWPPDETCEESELIGKWNEWNNQNRNNAG
jgi:hypothetical protein